MRPRRHLLMVALMMTSTFSPAFSLHVTEREQTQRNQTRTNVDRTLAGVAKSAELSRAVTAVITAWLEVRVLPGPPYNKINSLSGSLASLAAAIGDSRG